ncbi:hypothetical protein RhiXN_07861 [Rhizoctonia solani]|uniref:Uncharacterized protein n=1 Tax=Rhizoctonia solani TaxID=456999 RepID=A0A8H8P088_9AGAM|nr:uncharacterized protein RhiXN_07861 [Rhizoctonia solani]QRW22825.1 hypothetical protein RhiXN_07861 [Rhizoctonia solani]
MSDSKDRHLANLFEIELQQKADLDPGNYWELVWFLQLPLRLDVVICESLRRELTRTQPKNTFCGSLATISPWRRSKRPPNPGNQLATANVARVKLSPNHPTFKPAVKANQYTVPARPTTPNELCDALSAIATLACDAVGYAPVTLNQCRSPKVPNTPPEPESGPEPVTEQVPEEAAQCKPFPEPYPENGSLWVKDTLMQEDLAYFVAVGHYLRAPEDGYTIQDAAGDLYVLEYVAHEFYSSLFHAFSVEGNGESKRISLLPPLATTVIDLVRGWLVVPKSWKESSKLLPNH